MKLIVILIAISVNISLAAYSQKITFSVKDASLREVLQEVRKQSGYTFMFSSAFKNEARPVSVRLRSADIHTALTEIFRGQQFTFEIEDKTILVKELPAKLSESAGIIQQRSISGTVTDENRNRLPGVTVRIKGDARAGTITDASGNYIIQVPVGRILVFSYMGYQTQERPVGNAGSISVSLLPLQDDLDEVVIIGYGAVKKSDLTGSVATVNMEDLTKAPVGSFDEALAGRIAGVQVSSSDGQPGSGMDIVIRGANSLTQSNAPLYVIDGFPVEDFDNAALNPEEIASINILKDASATAIYGSRGANGVVIIETKKGEAGKPAITVNSSVGYQSELKQMEMLTPYEFVQYQIAINPATARRMYTTAELDPLVDTLYDPNGRTLEDYRNIQGTNWQDLLLRNAPMQNHNIAIRGGNSQTKYAISGSYFDQDGIIMSTGAKRYQGRVNLDQTISKKLSAGISANYSQNVRQGHPVNVGGGNFTTYLLYRAWAYRPVTGRDDLDLIELEDDPDHTNVSDVRINPLVSSQNDHTFNNSSSLLANAYVDYQITPYLTFKTIGSVRSQFGRGDRFYNTRTPQGSPQNRSHARSVHGLFDYSETKSWSNENTLTYARVFHKNHSLNAMGGFSLQDSRNANFGFGVQQLPNEDLGMYGLDEGIPYESSASGGAFSLVSYFGRVNYSYQSRYLFTATLRADGSSKFHPDNQWGYFPSAAFAWNIKNESFLKDVASISASKFRMSYGVTGNNRIGNYEYYSNLSLPLGSAYSFNNATPTHAIVPAKLGNPALKWESTEQTDVGLDLGLFGNRIEFTVDYYRKVTRDLLLNADMPITTGYTRSFKNIGSIQNTGLEFSLSTVNIRSPRFRWQSDFNISFNRNKVLSLTRNQDFMFSNMTIGQTSAPLYVSRVGYPAGMFYGFIFDGVYQYEDFDNPSDGVYILKNDVPNNGNLRAQIQPGDVRYRDVNGDHAVDDNDRVIMGRGQPIHTGGFQNNFSYGGFTLNVLLQWSYGNQIYNANRIIFDGSESDLFNVNQYASVRDRWTPENPSNTLFRVSGGRPIGYQSTRVLEDGSYLRLKTVSLNYELPTTLIRPWLLSRLNVHVSAQNLLTFTNYSGMDPETSVRHTVLTPGFDYSPYPQARTLVFGLNATF